MSEDRVNTAGMPPIATAALARFGDRLDDAQRAQVVEAARQLEEAAEALREFLVVNGDEPDFSFSVVDGVDS